MEKYLKLSVLVERNSFKNKIDFKTLATKSRDSSDAFSALLFFAKNFVLIIG